MDIPILLIHCQSLTGKTRYLAEGIWIRINWLNVPAYTNIQQLYAIPINMANCSIITHYSSSLNQNYLWVGVGNTCNFHSTVLKRQATI